ncbi:MAG: hypothetical protein KIC46_04870 [Clostridiales bacterium]|nr:hypothetical protein [Clostridiales bacterium]
MKRPFTKKQLDLLDKMDLPFDPSGDLSDEEELQIEESVSDYFALHGLAGNGDQTNQTGELCADVITILAQ